MKLRRLIAFLLVAALAFADSSGPNSPATAANSGGGIAWISPTSITSSDNIRSTSPLTPGSVSQNLQATQFGFAIPSGTIAGVFVEVEERQTGGIGVCKDLTIQLLKAGVAAGSNKASASAWPGADTFIGYGSSSDLWTTTWSTAEVNASNFGVQIATQETGDTDSATCGVDNVRITISYTPTANGSMGRRAIRSQTRTFSVAKAA
jgi:hypothetical protein